jgi:membrane protein implicated in regulation of membrane protease activity
MYLVAIAWMYVVVMMAVAEAMAPNGSVLGAVFTFLLYGVLPCSIVLYLMGTPMRRRARLAAERKVSAAQPDGGSEPASDAVAAERKEV